MRFRLTFVVIVLAALATGSPSAQSKELDNRTITCREFLASGQANMAALISWLRGYHAGKTGVIPYQSPDLYGGRLSFYCKQHPGPASWQSVARSGSQRCRRECGSTGGAGARPGLSEHGATLALEALPDKGIPRG